MLGFRYKQHKRKQCQRATSGITLANMQYSWSFYRFCWIWSFKVAVRILRRQGRSSELLTAIYGRWAERNCFSDDAKCSRKRSVAVSQKYSFSYSLALYSLKVVQGYRKQTLKFQAFPNKWATPQLPYSFALNLLQNFLRISPWTEEKLPKNIPAALDL